jgi:hypothetical protein
MHPSSGSKNVIQASNQQDLSSKLVLLVAFNYISTMKMEAVLSPETPPNISHNRIL